MDIQIFKKHQNVFNRLIVEILFLLAIARWLPIGSAKQEEKYDQEDLITLIRIRFKEKTNGP